MRKDVRMQLHERLNRLDSIIDAMPGVLVAFSGGADSAFLAEVAHLRLGPKAIALTADSPSLPKAELSAAIDLASERGWRHLVVSTDEMGSEDYVSNPVNRCYFCKSALFDVLGPKAADLGYIMALGTNADDMGDHRPGHVAADEAGARHPLLEAGLSKKDIREASSRLGLITADKPASACLASRFAYGVRVTREGLRRVESAEEVISSLGYRIVRVRDLGHNKARIEVGQDELARVWMHEEEIKQGLTTLGFQEVVIAEGGYRRGSLNDGVVTVPLRILAAPSSIEGDVAKG
jgi:uncharacterized protein